MTSCASTSAASSTSPRCAATPRPCPARRLPAAGLPWFMALFGRDSLITSYQALPFVPELARTTLLALAARQATAFDDFRDAEPGKILHELRFGELTVLGERPHSPYYGSADCDPAVPDPARRVRALDRRRRARPRARAERPRGARVDRPARRPRRRRLRRVRAPQRADAGSSTSAGRTPGTRSLFADGTIARAAASRPARSRATSTTPSVRAARLAREVWGDEELARRLEREAAELRGALQRATSGCRTSGYYALALDGDKRQVDSLTSNIGHLLWSGIVDRPSPPRSWSRT